MTKRYQTKPIDEWNVRDFHDYMSDKHRELFGCEYVPMRSWRMEQGLLGNLIGTARKQGTHDKAIIKRFIDEAFATYKPTPQYPGINFGFIYTYRRNILQRLQAEEKRKKERQENEATLDDLAEWL